MARGLPAWGLWVLCSALAVFALWRLSPPVPDLVGQDPGSWSQGPGGWHWAFGLALGWILAQLLLAPTVWGRRHGPRPTLATDDRAQAMTEFILVFPVLLFLVLAIFQLALLFGAHQFVQYAAYQSARSAAVWGSLGSGNAFYDDQVGQRIQRAATLATMGISPNIDELGGGFGTGSQPDLSDLAGGDLNSATQMIGDLAQWILGGVSNMANSIGGLEFPGKFAYAYNSTGVRLTGDGLDWTWDWNNVSDNPDLSNTDIVKSTVSHEAFLLMPIVSVVGHPHTRMSLDPQYKFITLTADVSFLVEHKRGGGSGTCGM